MDLQNILQLYNTQHISEGWWSPCWWPQSGASLRTDWVDAGGGPAVGSLLHLPGVASITMHSVHTSPRHNTTQIHNHQPSAHQHSNQTLIQSCHYCNPHLHLVSTVNTSYHFLQWLTTVIYNFISIIFIIFLETLNIILWTGFSQGMSHQVLLITNHISVHMQISYYFVHNHNYKQHLSLSSFLSLFKISSLDLAHSETLTKSSSSLSIFI